MPKVIGWEEITEYNSILEDVVPVDVATIQ
jgi:hypothetical protein